MKLNKQKVFKTISDYFFKKDEIEFAYIFGSYAIDIENTLSDIDIAIYQKLTNVNKSSYEYRVTELKIESELFQILPDYKFDVRSFNDAPIIIIGKILNEGKLIFFKNENFYYDYLENSILKYMDYSLIYNNLFNERYESLLNDR